MRQLLLTIAVCAFLAGCTRTTSSDRKPGDQVLAPTGDQSIASDSGKPINKYCAVNPNDEADPTLTTVYHGKVIAFCCEDCIPKFKADPEKYMRDLK